MEQTKVPVSRRAVLARVNRILAKEDQAFRISRSHGEKSNLGEAYILDTRKNTIVYSQGRGVSSTAPHYDYLKFWAEELGAIKDFEEMTEE